MANHRYSHFLPKWSMLMITVALVLTACTNQQAEQSKPKVFSIGVVSGGANMNPVFDSFKASMAELGYTEGKNLNYVYSGPASSPDKIDSITKSVLDAKIDLILALNTPATKSVQQATAGTNIPVVFLPVTDPVKSGFVQSVQRPGGNLTGISAGLSVQGQRLEWLLKLVPKIKRIYVPYDPGDEASAIALPVVQNVASQLGVQLSLGEVHSSDDITASIANLPADVDAIFIMPGSQVGSRLDDYIKASIEHKLPLTSPIISQVSSGTLISYAFSPSAIGKQAARMTDRILKGAKPAEVPVETSEYFLGINLKTAAAIGVEVPDEILRQAATVIR